MQHAVGPIPVGNPWIEHGPDPALLKAVEKLADGEVSDIIETELGVYLARVTQRIAARTPSLEAVRDRIREQLITTRAKAAAKQAAEAWRDKLKERRASGWRFEETFLTSDARPGQAVTFARTGPIGPIGEVSAVNSAAFGIPLGELTDVLDTPTGAVIIRPEERIPADAAHFAERQAKLREETLTKKQNEHVEQWLKDLRTRAKFKRFDTPTPPPPPPSSKPTAPR